MNELIISIILIIILCIIIGIYRYYKKSSKTKIDDEDVNFLIKTTQDFSKSISKDVIPKTGMEYYEFKSFFDSVLNYQFIIANGCNPKTILCVMYDKTLDKSIQSFFDKYYHKSIEFSFISSSYDYITKKDYVKMRYCINNKKYILTFEDNKLIKILEL